MIDVRDDKAMLVRLSDAQRRFEKGGAVPHAACELLKDLVDALADSGPLELGVSPSDWLSSIKSAERGIAAADDRSPREAVRRAKRSIRELKWFFGDRERTWIDWFTLPFLLIVVLPSLIFVLPFVLIGLLIEKRYLPDVRKTIVSLDLPDRVLFAHPVNATGCAASSAVRARLAAYVHPLVVATDRRLLLAEPSSELPVPSDRQQFSIAWSIPYPRIRTFSSKTVRGDSEMITVGTRERTVSYKMPGGESEALIAILRRRAPEAFDESPLPRRAGEVSAL